LILKSFVFNTRVLWRDRKSFVLRILANLISKKK